MQCKIASLFTVIVLLMLIPRPISAADNNPPCLTRAQAQAKYAPAHLYWHTINRCWDNIPVTRGRRVYAPPIRLPTERPAKIRDEAESNAAGLGLSPRPQAGGPSVFYPDLMPGAPPAPAMLSPEPATRWLFADFDEMFAPFVEWNARINGQFR